MPDFPVVVEFPVHWGEMDALGHINNARFFTWFESARIALLRKAGLLNDAQPALVPVLAATGCEFLRPIHFPSTVRVGARVESLGNTSVTMEYVVTLAAEPDAAVARGKSVAVIVDYRTGNKTPIPDNVRRVLETMR